MTNETDSIPIFDTTTTTSTEIGDQIIGGDGIVAGLDWWLWIVIGAAALLLLIALIVGIVFAVRRNKASSTNAASDRSEIVMPELATSSTMQMPPAPGHGNYAHVPRSTNPAGLLPYEVVPAIPPPLVSDYEMSNVPEFHSFRNDSFRNESESGRTYTTLPSSNNSDNSSSPYLTSWR